MLPGIYVLLVYHPFSFLAWEMMIGGIVSEIPCRNGDWTSPGLKKGTLLYHGTLALRNQTSANTLESIRSMMSPYVFMDVNLRSPWWTHSALFYCSAK